LYTLPDIIRVIKSRIKWEGQVACMGEMRNAYKTSSEEPERQRPLGRPKNRYEGIRVGLGEIG
jgi:hypothetical protein